MCDVLVFQYRSRWLPVSLGEYKQLMICYKAVCNHTVWTGLRQRLRKYKYYMPENKKKTHERLQLNIRLYANPSDFQPFKQVVRMVGCNTAERLTRV